MTDDDRSYLWEQLELFGGGYDWLVMEMSVHFARDLDQLQMGWVLRDGNTGAWIAAEVPQIMARLTDTHKVAGEVQELLAATLERVDPFP